MIKKIVTTGAADNELNDISFFEYSKLDGEEKSEYDFAIKYGSLEDFDLFKFGEFEERTFDFVKSFQTEFNTTDENQRSLFTFEKYLELVLEYSEFTNVDIAKESIFRLIQSYNYAINQTRLINQKENINLSHVPSDEEKRAGQGLFEGLSVLIQLKKLSEIMRMSVLEIEKQPYSLCFAFLKLSADESQFQRQLNAIRNS